MPKRPPKGTVRFPDQLWENLERVAGTLGVPVEVVVFSEMARWCRGEMGSIPPPPPELPADIERCDSPSGFVGVYRNGRGFKAQWKDRALGTFKTAEEAALARYKEKAAERKRTRELLEDGADPSDASAAAPIDLAVQPPPPVRTTVGRYKCPFCYDWVRGTCAKCGPMNVAQEKADAEKAEKAAKAAATPNPVAAAGAPA